MIFIPTPTVRTRRPGIVFILRVWGSKTKGFFHR